MYTIIFIAKSQSGKSTGFCFYIVRRLKNRRIRDWLDTSNLGKMGQNPIYILSGFEFFKNLFVLQHGANIG